MLSVNKQMIPFKNLPYYKNSLMGNWGIGAQFYVLLNPFILIAYGLGR